MANGRCRARSIGSVHAEIVSIQQFREPAVLADGVRVVAEVAHDLNQTLLLRSGAEGTMRGAVQHALSCETQEGIVL